MQWSSSHIASVGSNIVYVTLKTRPLLRVLIRNPIPTLLFAEYVRKKLNTWRMQWSSWQPVCWFGRWSDFINGSWILIWFSVPYTVRLNYRAVGMGVLSALKFISVCVFFHIFIYSLCLVSDFVCADALDGAMIVLAVYTMNLAHPGRLLGGSSDDCKTSTC